MTARIGSNNECGSHEARLLYNSIVTLLIRKTVSKKQNALSYALLRWYDKPLSYETNSYLHLLRASQTSMS